MKLILTLIAIFVVTACSTMKPVESSPEQLRDRISAGEVVHEGDTVRILTVEGKEHTFAVTAVTDKSIIGNNIEVPISNIAAIDMKVKSNVKSGAFFVGSMALFVLLLAAISFA